MKNFLLKFFYCILYIRVYSWDECHRWRIVKDRMHLWKTGIRDLVMELCCALHNVRVRLTPRVIAPSSSYYCLRPGPETLRPVQQSWSRARGLMPRAAALGCLPHHPGVDTLPGPGAHTWALRLSCGVLVGAAETALCDRISSLVHIPSD